MDGSTLRGRELVHRGATDWDFLSTPAEANGPLVLAAGNGLPVQRPHPSARAPLKVAWGSDPHEFRADLDARAPWTSLKAVAWNAAQQAMVDGEAMPPTSLGSLASVGPTALAVEGLPLAEFLLHLPLPAGEEELTAWNLQPGPGRSGHAECGRADIKEFRMNEDPRCCGSGTCIIDADGRCWCGQQWDGEKMCHAPLSHSGDPAPAADPAPDAEAAARSPVTAPWIR